MVHHQWLLEEKEKGLFTHEVSLATLCYALKPSCGCAISQIRYWKGKRKKAAFTSGAALSCPGGVSVKMGAGAVPLPQLQPPPGHAGHHSSPAHLLLEPYAALSGLDSGWLCTRQFLSLLRLSQVNIAILICRDQIQCYVFCISKTSENGLGLRVLAHR